MKVKDWSGRIIWATILIMVVRYAGAFMVSDVGVITGISSEVFTGFLVLTGIGMGILDVVGGGLLFNGWSKTMPRTGDRWSARFKVLTFVVFGLVVSGLFILVPFTIARTSQETITEALGGKGSFFHWTWATMVNIIPYLLIAGVFVGNKLVTSLEAEEVKQPTSKLPEVTKKVTSNLPVDWRTIRPKLSTDQVAFIATHEPKEIVKAFESNGYNIAPRTASNWRTYAQRELGNSNSV